jgi:MFS family permease
MKTTHTTARIFVSSLLIASIGQVCSDSYLPSFSAMMHGLHTSIHTAQLSVAVFVLVWPASQLVYGLLSDAFGRRAPLTGVSMGGHVIAEIARHRASLLGGAILCNTEPKLDEPGLTPNFKKNRATLMRPKPAKHFTIALAWAP